MKIFRKILALILCLCMMFAFASCEELTGLIDKIKGKTDQNTPTGITKEEWNAAIEGENFDNVTFSMLVTFKGESEVYPVVCKLDGDKATVKEGNYEYDAGADEVAAIRSIYMNTVLAILENFENFTYDSEANIFTGNTDIVYNVKVIEYDAKITASNVKVKIDENKKIAEIVCGMKQEYTENGEPKALELDVIFTFSDYGTTVVTPVGGGNGGISTSAVSEAYNNSCKYKNLTLTVDAVEVLNNGTELPEDMEMRSTATALYMNTATHEVYYSIENGRNYMYMNSGNGWEKYEGSSSAPVGMLVQMYAGMFEDVFDMMSYDAESATYHAENVYVPLYETKTHFDYVNIKIRDGLIYQIEYVMDTYDYSGETPTVHGKGYATMTFSDYGTTVVVLPNLNDGTPGDNGNAQGAMTEDEWNKAFENTEAAENFTISMTNTRIPFDGETSSYTDIMETTEFASHTTSPGSTSEVYHSNEDGQYYSYYTSDGTTWTKSTADPQYCPIGSTVMSRFTSTFKSVYKHLEYDEEEGAYVGSNFILAQNGTDFTIHNLRIRFSNGRITEIYYESDMVGSSDSETVVIGTGTAHILITNYGTTTVELPSEYIDETSNS